MHSYKKDYPFDFAKAMKFFLPGIDKSIYENGADKAGTKISLKMRTNSYPYNSDVMKRITKTLDVRGYRVIMTAYKTNYEEDADFKYEYKFSIEKNKNN